MTALQTKLQAQGNALFKKILDESLVQILPGSESKEVCIWKGKITQTCLELGIPYGSYRKVYLALQTIGAIQELARGVRASPTLIAVLKEPTDDVWEDYAENVPRPALTKSVQAAKLAAEVKNFLDSVGGIDIAEALKNHEKRITTLEGKRKPKATSKPQHKPKKKES